MAQGTPQTWTATYETLPDGTDSPDGGDDALRNLKATVRNAVNHEHKLDTTTYTSTTEVGWHRLGSAVIYYGSSEPATRPDGETALDSNDAGRIWFNSSTNEFWIYTGSAWSQAIDLVVDAITANGIVTCDSDLILPRRTSDPASPAVGQIWLRTDL